MSKHFSLLFLIFYSTLFSFGQDKYSCSINLNEVQDKKIKVSIITPKNVKGKYIFQFPKTVPGTYANLNYGRFISDFQAYDENNQPLTVTKKEPNTYTINGKNLSKVTYSVSPSWDTPVDKDAVFEPAGTNFEKDKCFILNQGGVFGYLEGAMMYPYEITITHPEKLYGASSMDVSRTNTTTDVWKAPDYVRLVDSPIMYAPLDTAIIKVGNTEVLISCYSTDKNINAKALVPSVQPTVTALQSFLKVLPVKRYVFLFYFASLFGSGTRTGAFGALEHSYSSLYYLPVMPVSAVVRQVNDVASHEFLHIITPLNLHSREIHEFNFANPKMSQHLWLYEGSTEYYSHLIQLKANMISLDDFFREMRGKIEAANMMPKDMSMTKMSANVLDEKYHKAYRHVYDKGALLCMGLDLEIMRLTQGKMTLRKVIEQLSVKYGAERPFEDNALFKEIIAITHPDVKKFIDKHIIGVEPLDYTSLFKTVGIRYERLGKVKIASLEASGIELGMLSSSKTQITKDCPEYGLKYGDYVKSINGIEISIFTAMTIGEEIKASAGKPVKIVVEREGKTIEVEKPLKVTEEDASHSFILENISDPIILQCRKAWMTNE
jgi:predicted metalloprotease with PDZ domain